MHPKPRNAEPLPKFCEDIDRRRNGEILPPAAKAARLQRQRPHDTSGRGDDKIGISGRKKLFGAGENLCQNFVFAFHLSLINAGVIRC